MKQKISGFQLLLLFLGGFVLLFIIAPIAGMFFIPERGQIAETLNDEQVISSIKLTLWTSMLGTAILSIGAVPLGYVLARKRFFGRGFILGLINIPIVIPHSAAGIAILGIISRDSFLGKFADSFGYSLVGNPIAIIFAMAFVSVPFLINASVDAFSAVPERLEKTALNLGASPAKVFFKISLPLAKRGVFTGFIMMWARGMSEFGAVIIVAFHPMITPVLIYDRFASFGLKYATPVAVVFVIITLVFFISMRIISGSKITNNR